MCNCTKMEHVSDLYLHYLDLFSDLYRHYIGALFRSVPSLFAARFRSLPSLKWSTLQISTVTKLEHVSDLFRH